MDLASRPCGIACLLTFVTLLLNQSTLAAGYTCGSISSSTWRNSTQVSTIEWTIDKVSADFIVPQLCPVYVQDGDSIEIISSNQTLEIITVFGKLDLFKYYLLQSVLPFKYFITKSINYT